MPTERQKMLAGERYDPFDPELVAGRSRARDLCQQLNATRESDDTERRPILRDLFGNGGDFNCIILDVCRVRVGDFTLFGPAVQIYTPSIR